MIKVVVAGTLLLLINGCKSKDDSPVAQTSNTGVDFYADIGQYASTKEQNGLFCELALKKDTLSAQDTLVITYSVQNKTDSLKIYEFTDHTLLFSLKSEGGRMLMKDILISGSWAKIYYNVGSTSSVVATEKLRDDSGLPIAAGVYKLRARLNHSDFPILMLTVTIK